MNDQFEPVAAEEYVYRRVHSAFHASHLSVSIQFPAFRPNQEDTTGISLFRAKFLYPAETLTSVSPNKQADYYVARLAVRDLLALGLSVSPEPEPAGPAGHCVIPELCWSTYEADKKRLKPILLALAALASNDLVLRPQ
jgi:hypothetical protein